MKFFVHYYDEITHSIPPLKKLSNCSITSHFLAPKSSKRRNIWFYPHALLSNYCILSMCEHLVINSSYPQTKDIYMYYQIFFSNTPAFTTKNKTAKGTINKCKSQATITEQTYHEPIIFFKIYLMNHKSESILKTMACGCHFSFVYSNKPQNCYG